MDLVNYWSGRSGIPAHTFPVWLGITSTKFYDCKKWYGQANGHNCCVSRDSWLEKWEKQAMIDSYLLNPNEGYRRLAYMMLDPDVVPVSPSSVYRVLGSANLDRKWNYRS